MVGSRLLLWPPFSRASSEGAHRVRVEVQFTAMDPGGLRLDPAGFIVDGLGSGRPGPLWSSPEAATLDAGESASATMVFELPNKAIALVLEGPRRRTAFTRQGASRRRLTACVSQNASHQLGGDSKCQYHDGT